MLPWPVASVHYSDHRLEEDSYVRTPIRALIPVSIAGLGAGDLPWKGEKDEIKYCLGV